MPYATVAQLRDYLPQTKVSSASDTLLASILARATDMVRAAMRAAIPDPAFDYAAWGSLSAKRVRSYGGTVLWLPPHQAGSVTSVAYGDTTAINSSTYEETPSGALQIITPTGWTSGWPGPWRGVWGQTYYTVTAIWGYGPDVPPAIEELTLQVAVNLWRAKDQGGYSETVGVDGQGAVRVVGGLNAQQRMILETAVAPYQLAAL